MIQPRLNMQVIWRKTIDIFWQHPALWLPVVFADAIVFCLKWLQRDAIHRIVMWLAETHSVLGEVQYRTDGRWFRAKVFLLTLPITWGTYFVSILLYVVALIVVNGVLAAASESGRLPVWAWLDVPRPRYLSVLLLCLKTLALCAVSLGIFFGLTSLLQTVHLREVMINPVFTYGITALLGTGIAYVISPAAVTILRADLSHPLTTLEASRARVAAALAVAGSVVISLFVQHAGQSLLDKPQHLNGVMLHGIELLSSLLSALPYIPLFIALSLIASNKDSETTAAPIVEAV